MIGPTPAFEPVMVVPVGLFRKPVLPALRDLPDRPIALIRLRRVGCLEDDCYRSFYWLLLMTLKRLVCKRRSYKIY